MIKPGQMTEQEFMAKCRAYEKIGKTPRDIVSEATPEVLPPKRAWYWLGKWYQKGIWEIGVSCASGWFIDGGKE